MKRNSFANRPRAMWMNEKIESALTIKKRFWGKYRSIKSHEAYADYLGVFEMQRNTSEMQNDH